MKYKGIKMTPIIPYHKNQKFGIVDVELNFLIECKYFQILKPFKFNQGWLCFTLNERKRYGWIYYENGQIVEIEPQYSAVNYDSQELIGVQSDDGSWGFVDHSNQQLISMQFSKIYPFSNHRAIVSIARKNLGSVWGVVDVNGHWTIHAQYQYLGEEQSGLRCFKSYVPNQGNLYGFVSDETGQEVISAQFSNASHFCDGIAVVSFGQGKQQYFSVINSMGEIIADQLKHAELCAFGYSLIQRNKYLEFINKNGQAVLKTKETKVHQLNFLNNENLNLIRTGRRELIATQYKKKWGFYKVDDSGVKLQIEHQFDELSDYGFRQQRCAVSIDQQAAYIDENGVMKAPLGCTDVFMDYHGALCTLVKYSLEKPYAFMDQEGQRVIDFKYAMYFGNFDESGLLYVFKEKGTDINSGFIDQHGVEYWQ